MTRKQIFSAVAAATTFVAIVLAGMSFSSTRVRAQTPAPAFDFEALVAAGLKIAPVKLSYNNYPAERDLVGLGSYIVNAQGDCNGCHNSPDLGGEFVVPTGMPYFLSPPKIKSMVNPAGYLGGGMDFGPYPSAGPFPDIIARNLTPDWTNLPAGGMQYMNFVTVMRTGKDFDGIHPTCTGAPTGTCLPAPFDGSLLQIMPWPTFTNMSDYDIQAIYEYLKAIPCISHKGSPGLQANIYNTCPGQQ
jgi:hypothetical protein